MEIRKGIAISPGVAIAPAVIPETEEFRIRRRTISSSTEISAEIDRAKKAVDVSIEQLVDQREQVAATLGRETAAIFDWHLGILKDHRLSQQINEAISKREYTAAYAIATVMRQYHRRFLSVKDPVIAQREKDVTDIERRLMRNVLGDAAEDLAHLSEGAILVAHDLTPSQAVELAQTKVAAIATDIGGQTSHTAIVAKSLGIPAVMGLTGITDVASGGDTVIVDGTHGLAIVRPDLPTLQRYQSEVARFEEFEKHLIVFRDQPSVSSDGTRIELLANIEFPHEAKIAIEKGADGIGLYRTEFLFLKGTGDPTEQEHFEAYRTTIQAMGGRPITIRTLDLGADKYTQGKSYEPERNPFLGLRSIRYCLQNLATFKAQLRAILRAAVGTTAQIMFPLITGLMELRQAKMTLNDAIEDLDSEGIPYPAKIPIGIMIETPSAVIQAKELAREVDFFSIGTNDLIQYTLAVDRGNERVAPLYTASHPAVLRQIRDVVRAASKAGIPACLCGEMAGAPLYTRLLLGLGLRQLSMSPPNIPEIKQIIRQTHLKDTIKLVRKAFSFETDRQVTNYLRDDTRRFLPPEAF